jgi:hypothetical protein
MTPAASQAYLAQVAREAKAVPTPTSRAKQIQAITDAMDQNKSILVSAIAEDSAEGSAETPPSDPSDERTLQELMQDLLVDPEGWLDEPNPNYGGKKPRELLGTDKEIWIYNSLNAADLGLF